MGQNRKRAGPPLPLARPSLQRNSSTLQRNPSRRINFDGASNQSASAAANAEEETLRGRPGPPCSTCCAWIALTIGCIIIILLILGGVCVGVLQGSMPEIRVVTLDFDRFNLTKSGSTTLLDADVSVKLNMSNNHDSTLTFGALKIDVSSEGVKMGSLENPSFTLNPKSSMELKVQTSVRNEEVYDDDGEELETNYKWRKVGLDVAMRGKVTILLKGVELKNFPLKISCHNISQTAVDSGLLPQCTVRVITVG